MAKTWYPVIDYLSCAECGMCVGFCPHGVYDVVKAPSPVVIQPEHCINHCHACGNNCPNGAITYVGDDTGWVPPHGEMPVETNEPCCCGGEAADKTVSVEYLYLDLQTCDRCIGTDAVLEEVLQALRPALKLAGYEVTYKKIEVSTQKLAMQYHFLSSPSIRVNEQDIIGSVTETACGCCSEISGTDVDCRAYEYEGKTYDVPPKEMLAKAILTAVFVKKDSCSCGGYELPENLKRFFKGKTTKEPECSCGSNCCGN